MALIPAGCFLWAARKEKDIRSNAHNTNLLKDVPSYQMSTVMVSRLLGDKDFGKVVFFYRMLQTDMSEDSAFLEAFGMPVSTFLECQ
jgi:hypothetical protein